jgi:hypothetical protein
MNHFLRVESAAILIGSVALAFYFPVNWWWFIAFAVLPDAALLLLLARPKQRFWPHLVYDAVHVYAAPMVVAVALWPYRPVFVLGWVAHIAADRLIGIGFRSLRSKKEA